MLHLWSFQWLFLHFLLGLLHVQCTRATWLSSNTSGVQLLGLFPDADNASVSETTTLSVHSRAMFKAAIILSQRFDITIEDQFIGWQAAQTSGNMIGALSSTCRLMSTSNIVGIVGPAFSREAHVIAALSERVGIPVISYAATDPELSDKNVYPAFYRTIPSDKAAASAIVKLFIRFNWTSCIVVYQNDELGSDGVDAISEAFNNNSLMMSETLAFDISTRKFRGDLKATLSASSTRIILLLAETTHASTILQFALDNDVLGPQFLWISYSRVSLSSFNQKFYQKLIGMITIEPTAGSKVDVPVNTTLLNAAYDTWEQYEPETFPGPTQVDNHALFAFDATWSLIQSLRKLCSTGFNSSSSCLSVVNSSFCFDCRFLNANAFFDIISTTEFLGVSGAMQFSNNTTDRINGTYYMVYNVQPSANGLDYVPILQCSNSDDWEATIRADVILWPGSSLVPPTGLPGLSGVTLRIGVIQAPPFTMITNVINTSEPNTTKLIGYVPDLIEILRNRMGFIPEIILAPSNQTYDELIQAVANGAYDIVVGDVTTTAERREIVDFSYSIFDNSLRIIVREANSVDIDFFSYLKPFSFHLWLAILAALLYAAVLIFLLERRENEAIKNKSTISSVAMSVWYSFGTITGYGADFHVQTAAGRLLSTGLYLMSIILVATYTANLASSLTLQKSKNIISGIEDIKNGKLPFSRIGILVGSYVEKYYLREISGGSRNFCPLKSQSEIYSYLLNGMIDASILDTGLLEYATCTLYCNLTLIGSDFDPSAYGIVTPKEWVYAQALDINILSLRESGALDDLKRKWFAGKTCSDLSVNGASISIGIEAVSGLFLTFAVISVLSLLLFIWLKGFIIKDYLWTLVHRNDPLVQQARFVGKLRTQIYYQASQIFQPNSDSSPATRI